MTVPPPLDIVVMGVSGTGRTTAGGALAEQLGLPFAEGDEFHSEASRQKMASNHSGRTSRASACLPAPSRQ